MIIENDKQIEHKSLKEYKRSKSIDFVNNLLFIREFLSLLLIEGQLSIDFHNIIVARGVQ